MIRFTVLFLFISIANCPAQQTVPIIQIDVSNSIVSPKFYITGKTSSAPIIDGRDDDISWQKALFTDSFIDIEGIKKAGYDTRCKMLWDDQYLYLYARLEEDHVWGDISERDAIIYHNNDFEIFLDPEGNGGPYGEIEINALGTVWDLMLSKPYRVHGKPIFNWNIEGLRSAVYVEGSLNTPGDTDKYWSIEMAIPMLSLTELKSRRIKIPDEGDQWRINFSRVQWEHVIQDGIYQRRKENGQLKSENNWVWSPQMVINMHEPEKWGYLQFSHQENTEKVVFDRDEDELAKQILFALFREIRFGKDSFFKDKIKGEQVIINAFYENGRSLEVAFYKTLSGFELLFKKDDTESLIIDQEGRLKKLK